MKEKSLKVYGLDIPKVIGVLPVNLPAIEVNEQRMDNLFLLDDQSIALIDYENDYKQLNKLKYLGYILRCLRGLTKESYNPSNIQLRFIVIYTADVKRGTTNPCLSTGALTLNTEEAFLSDIDGKEECRLLTEKMKLNAPLTDEDLMKLIILPLTFQGKKQKQEAAKTAIQLAETIPDSDQQTFALAGILSFSDKIITEEQTKSGGI